MVVLASLTMLAFGCANFGTSATPAPTTLATTPSIVGPTATVTTGPVALAFATRRGVYVAAADGTGGRELTIDVCSREGPADLDLSPDGHHLAFACYNTEGEGFRARLYLLDLASGSMQRIADWVADWRSMAWSPDGRYLAYFVYRNIGPAPVSAFEVWAYELATNRRVRLDEPRHFGGPLVWDPGEPALVYRVGDPHHYNYTGPVHTYRATLDGAGATPWRLDVDASLPGPNGYWLGVQEPVDESGAGTVVIISPDGTMAPLSTTPAPGERPLGWLGADPVVWRKTEGPFTPVSEGPGGVWWLPAPGSTLPRGEVWLAGSMPRRLLANVPIVSVGRTAALAGNRLLYVDQWQGHSVWLADVSAGLVSRLPVDGKQLGPMVLRTGS